MKYLILLLIPMLAISTEHREHGAHQHGAGTLGIAFDGVYGKIELKIPSESIMGFEHQAKSKADQKKQSDAFKTLETKISDMIVFDPALTCKFSKDKLEATHEAKSSHGDTIALFNVTCAKDPSGTELTFNFQKYFSKIKDLDVQVIVGNLQKAVEAKSNGTKLLLK